ncbi:MAG: helix-turn-helix domain-containing protein [Alicyclobacillus herbarius]|uniref:helix-turn-helix domain-containing protein n=1 Tax=Alicyclobacillus herbarius TaxID=122960 RepID=UPI0023542D2D|nr:helix-turn-helix transcriptional regulator [Alicyclobacillus herbarius]MCL6631190.1 helix-turn-helix domain-containing protein [Alicyclobacillus herbarius]
MQPWTLLRQLRRQAGWTQAEAAAGRLTTSELSQIENGRVMPGPRTIRWLCARYGVDAEEVLNAYARLRQAERLRRDLYRAAVRMQRTQIAAALKRGQGLLGPFETRVYEALVHALAGQPGQAERLLTEAWKYGLQETGLTKRAVARVLVSEARVHFLAALACGRIGAAFEWQRRMRARVAALHPSGHQQGVIQSDRPL